MKKEIEGGLKFDIVLTNPPFSMKYRRKEKDEGKIMKEYDMAEAGGEEKGSLKSNIMFMERYRDLLNNGGKLITIIDDSVLNNPSEKQFRDELREHFIIRAVISLPRNTFINADTNVKTSVLYLKKKEKVNEEQPDVFMAIAENVGHNDAGKETSSLNELSPILNAFFDFEKGNFKKTNKIFLTSGREITDRLDCYNYAPDYKKIIKELKKKKEMRVLI